MTELQHNGDLRGVSEPLEVLVRRRTEWQLVEIVRHPVYGNQLLIDHDLQVSEADFAYNTAMTAPALTLEHCRRAAILGGGDGGVLRELLLACDRAGKGLERVTLVDIDGEVVELCRRHMPVLCGDAFEDPRADVRIGDAFAWIEQARDLDAVIYDLTMEPVRGGISRREFIGEILSKIQTSLRPGGVISIQACGEQEPQRELLLEEIAAGLDERFTDRSEQQVMIPSYGELWTFMAARKP